MYKFKINIKTKCPKHPYYNPDKQSPTVCDGCQRLWDIHHKANALTQALREGDKVAGRQEG